MKKIVYKSEVDILNNGFAPLKFSKKAKPLFQRKENKTDKIYCDPSPDKRHNFPITGSECIWCGINQNELSGRKLKGVREFRSIN